MSTLLIKARTLFTLGAFNAFRVLLYRLRRSYGLSLSPCYDKTHYSAEFFTPISTVCFAPKPTSNWGLHANYFGVSNIPLADKAPNWHLNPLQGGESNPSCPWWRLSEFNASLGDVKLIWEASRFDWVLAFAEHIKLGDKESLQRLNHWLADWCKNNPPYRGINWKCGQEAGIRVMHLAMAAIIIEQVENPSLALTNFLTQHLQRIATTLSYALSQNNNHGTSEAAALYIGGTWLDYLGFEKAKHWALLGQRSLEKLVSRIIQPDGSFSQHSLNYHRVLLDTLSMVEIWRRQLALPSFSKSWQEKAAAAAAWLACMVDETTGDAPNLGANDGARLLPLTDSDYRDYRPSVQLGMALFQDQRVYDEEGVWNVPLQWLTISLPCKKMPPLKSQIFDDGGYAVLRRGPVFLLFRYPRFRFRPSHADALHLDLRINSGNLLRGPGSYSYNTDANWMAYFPGTASHNTIQFDKRDQMPKLSRFLFGDWLKTESQESLFEKEENTTFAASYRDRQGCRHSRRVELSNGKLRVEDKVSGFKHCAILRWRLKPGNWQILGETITNGQETISIKTTMPIQRFELVEGWESRYYTQKQTIPVLEIEIREPGCLITEIDW